ncbi:MAG: hypothetical protein HY294_00030 [Candidatus Rokubacteria bacterium]|nr:hypothetical protein [Candidatus Rokubacteria bacterium]MBI3824366.1 hypothetical protein [Candidatus Rokubacteria bacterium]
MDAVLGYHLNPLMCGVAKFNLSLAGRLGIPVAGVLDPDAARFRRPLVSVKLSEFRAADATRLAALLDTAPWRGAYALFLHDWTATEIERRLLAGADVAFCGNAEIAAAVRGLRADAVEAWCPSTVAEPARAPGAELSVFSFGMAHKVRAELYGRLRELLEATGRSYRLNLSTALHEDTTLDGSFTAAFEALGRIFGDRVHFLGYLSDAAVTAYLAETTFFAAFFDRGVRANNTTVNAAMRCGAVVVTNLDGFSPPSFAHGVNVLDIARCERLPLDAAERAAMGARARATALGEVGWPALLDLMAGRGAAAGPAHR